MKVAQRAKGSEISDRFQLHLNELDILVQFEEDIISGKIKQTGNYTTRDWSFLVTELANDFDQWKEDSP